MRKPWDDLDPIWLESCTRHETHDSVEGGREGPAVWFGAPISQKMKNKEFSQCMTWRLWGEGGKGRNGRWWGQTIVV